MENKTKLRLLYLYQHLLEHTDSDAAVLFYRNRERYPDKRILVKKLVIQGVAEHVIKAL